MNPEDRLRFGQSMGIMAVAFQKTPDKPFSDTYWRILQDMTIEDFEAACLTLVNTRKITGTFPLIAEIREAAGASDLRVITAWDKLMYAIENHAPYDSVQFDDPVINHIVRQWGGWTAMGEWPAEETKWKKKEFEKLYEAYSKAPLPEQTGHLVGLTEAENRTHFPEFVPKPILITGSTGNFKSLEFEPVEAEKLKSLRELIRPMLEN